MFILNFLLSPFQALSRGCLYGAGCVIGAIIALILVGMFFGLINDFVVRVVTMLWQSL